MNSWFLLIFLSRKSSYSDNVPLIPAIKKWCFLHCEQNAFFFNITNLQSMTTLEEFFSYRSYHRRKFKTENSEEYFLVESNFSESFLTFLSLQDPLQIILWAKNYLSLFFGASKLTVSKAQRYSNCLLIGFTICNTNNSKFEGYFYCKTFIKTQSWKFYKFDPKKFFSLAERHQLRSIWLVRDWREVEKRAKIN